MEAVIQKEGVKIFLHVEATNKSPNLQYTTFTIKLNANSFKLNPIAMAIDNLQLNSIGPGQSTGSKIELDCSGACIFYI